MRLRCRRAGNSTMSMSVSALFSVPQQHYFVMRFWDFQKYTLAVLTVLSVAKNLLLIYSKKLNIRTLHKSVSNKGPFNWTYLPRKLVRWMWFTIHYIANCACSIAEKRIKRKNLRIRAIASFLPIIWQANLTSCLCEVKIFVKYM